MSLVRQLRKYENENFMSCWFLPLNIFATNKYWKISTWLVPATAAGLGEPAMAFYDPARFAIAKRTYIQIFILNLF